MFEIWFGGVISRNRIIVKRISFSIVCLFLATACREHGAFSPGLAGKALKHMS